MIGPKPLNIWKNGEKQRRFSDTHGAILNNNDNNSHLFGQRQHGIVCANEPIRGVKMSNVFTKAAVLVAAAIVAGQAALAKPALKDNQKVANSFVQLGIADEIRKNCDSISPRLMKIYSYVQGIKSYAEGLGYTDAEIDAYASNDAEKNRLLGIAYDYMQSKGVVKGQADTYCALGRAEIAANSAAGKLLRAK